MLRVGIVGVDSTHTRANASILNGGQIGDARCVALWGHDRSIAAGLARELGIDQVVDRPEQLLSLVDAVMICDRYGEAHYAHARPFVEVGCPIYIDKPMTDRLDEAQALVRIAKERGTRLMSGSSLRFAPVVLSLKERLPALGPLRSIVLTGPAEGAFPDPRARLLPFYGIHLTELMQAIMGQGVAWVQSSGKGRNEVAAVAYRDGRMAILNLLRDWKVGYHLAVFGQDGGDEAQFTTNDYQVAYLGQMQAFLDMARTGAEPIPTDSTLEALETILAVDRSGQSGEIVHLTGA
ncbi:MAG: Gfo/Idh/MocA family oxidoreductase [Anaerolineae bacterium]|nr:Gfo/Idh/MocA family oxidoreductase [Anaerolineae bacterium]